MAIHIHVHKKTKDTSIKDSRLQDFKQWCTLNKRRTVDPKALASFAKMNNVPWPEIQKIAWSELTPIDEVKKLMGVKDSFAKDKAKYVSEVTIKLPNGKLAPNGTVFYKVGPNLYRPYYATTGELDVRVPVDKFTIEDSKAKDAITIPPELVAIHNKAITQSKKASVVEKPIAHYGPLMVEYRKSKDPALKSKIEAIKKEARPLRNEATRLLGDYSDAAWEWIKSFPSAQQN